MVMAVDAPRGELGLAEAAALSPEEVLARLGSGLAGLSSETRPNGCASSGPNALGTHRVRATAVLFRQIRNPILVLLLGAALVSGLTGGGTNARHHRGDRRPQRRPGFLQRVPGRDGDGRPARPDPPRGRGAAGTDARAGSRSRTWCPATSCRCASATWCRPTCAC